MPEMRDAAAGLNFHATGKACAPLNNMLKSSAAQAGTLIGLDKNCALEMVEAGGILTEYDKPRPSNERAQLLRPQALQKYLQTLQKFSPQRLINSTERKPDVFSGKEQNDKRKYGALQGKSLFGLDNAALASLNCVCHLFCLELFSRLKDKKAANDERIIYLAAVNCAFNAWYTRKAPTAAALWNLMKGRRCHRKEDASMPP